MNTPPTSQQPQHPGHFLRLEMQSRQETPETLAEVLHISIQTLQDIFEGHEPFTPEMAQRLEHHWGSSGFLLLEHQKDLDQL